MRVLFLISGKNTPASRFRILNYLPYLEGAKVRCTVLSSFPSKYEYFSWIGFRPSQFLKRFVRYLHYLITFIFPFDIVFFERELFDNNTYDLELKFIKGAKKTVLDVDDAIFLRYPKKFKIIAEKVDLIIAGNDMLAEKAKEYNSNTVVLPTSVLLHKYPVKSHVKSNNKITIGWTGLDCNISSIQIISNALNKLANDFCFKLCIISSTPENISKLNLSGFEIQHIKWSPKTEYNDLAIFDIGVMPLVDDQWSSYKCGLKLIQYMAMGIPVVASPVGINKSIVNHCINGFCASNEEDWYNFLKNLITSTNLRTKMGTQARTDIEKSYGTETNSKVLKQHFENLFANSID